MALAQAAPDRGHAVYVLSNKRPGNRNIKMKCRICGQNKQEGLSFIEWCKLTFTDHDKLLPGNIICHDCLFWFDESSQELARIVGKDKAQRMRNYSHFVVKGQWIPLSKSNKARMAQLLLGDPFPELGAIAESGQKHIVFRARRNPEGSKAGWVQFEEQSLYTQWKRCTGQSRRVKWLITEKAKPTEIVGFFIVFFQNTHFT